MQFAQLFCPSKIIYIIFPSQSVLVQKSYIPAYRRSPEKLRPRYVFYDVRFQTIRCQV